MAPDSGIGIISDPTPSRFGDFSEDQRIDFWAVLLILAKRIRRISVITLVSLALGVLIAFLLRPYFEATAVIMPPQQQSSAINSLLGQLGSIAGLGVGSNMLSSLKSPADMYIGILETKGMGAKLIAKYDLRKRYRTKNLEDTLIALKRHVTFDTGKDGLIHITVKDRNPELASNVANGYVDELYALNSRLAVTEAAQRRVFFDQQLRQEQGSLADAEVALRNTEQQTGAIQPIGQAEILLRTVAETQAELSQREVQLQSLLTNETEENPEVIVLRNQITALRSQLADLENSQKALKPGDVEIPAGKVPEVALEYARKYREMKYHETLFELLLKEDEAAHIDEAKSAPLIQVVDRAVPPDKKAGPSRKLVTLGFTLGGLIVACLWALSEDKLRRMRANPTEADKLRQLQVAFRRK